MTLKAWLSSLLTWNPELKNKSHPQQHQILLRKKENPCFSLIFKVGGTGFRKIIHKQLFACMLQALHLQLEEEIHRGGNETSGN